VSPPFDTSVFSALLCGAIAGPIRAAARFYFATPPSCSHSAWASLKICPGALLIDLCIRSRCRAKQHEQE
jgi:hypothetical protein